MRSMVALVLAVAVGCASSEYRPRTSGISSASYNGAARWYKNGEPIRTSLQNAMSDVPAAAAYEKKSRTSATIGWSLFGVAAGLLIASIAVSNSGDHCGTLYYDHDCGPGAALAIGGLILGSIATDVVAAMFLSKSLAQRADAVNVYNDAVAAHSLPPVIEESAVEPTPSAPDLPSPEPLPTAPEPADINSL